MKNIRTHCFLVSPILRISESGGRIGIFLLLMLFCNFDLAAQSFTVKGKVLDANDEPLIGAAIVLKSQSTVGTLYSPKKQ